MTQREWCYLWIINVLNRFCVFYPACVLYFKYYCVACLGNLVGVRPLQNSLHFSIWLIVYPFAPHSSKVDLLRKSYTTIEKLLFFKHSLLTLAKSFPFSLFVNLHQAQLIWSYAEKWLNLDLSNAVCGHQPSLANKSSCSHNFKDKTHKKINGDR